MYYTGIGSRKTPERVLQIMIRVGQELADRGLILRSGAADGADSAFEKGCSMAQGNSEIYLPWKKFNKHPSVFFKISDEALALAAQYHPAWTACSDGARRLHARNCYQILGQDLKTPSAFVLYWTATDHGGTLQAVRIAKAFNVPIFNMAEEGCEEYGKVVEFYQPILERIQP